MVTEAKRHKLFTLLEGAIGPEGADILMEIVDPLAGSQLATKADLVDLRAGIELAVRVDIAELKQDLSRTFASWLFLSQGVMVAIVGLLISLR